MTDQANRSRIISVRYGRNSRKSRGGSDAAIRENMIVELDSMSAAIDELKHRMEGKQMLDLCELEDVRKALESNLDSACSLAMSLPSEEGGEAGVVGALRRLAADTARSTSATCQFICLVDGQGISALSALGLYRVAERWLEEAVGRLQGRNVTIQLTRRDGIVELTITDETRRAKGQLSDAVTLATIYGMARAVGGGVVVATKPGGGAKMTCWVPYGTCDDVINFHAA
jgi:signal transduction histidine kinase